MRRVPIGPDAALVEGVDVLLRRFRGMDTAAPAGGGGGVDAATTGGPIEVSYLVASSTARNEIKAVADYVCSGVGDQVEINTAIAALAAASPDGGRIMLTEGTYYLSDRIKNPDDTYLEIVGSGQFTTIIDGESSPMATVGNALFDFESGHVTISDLSISFENGGPVDVPRGIYGRQLTVRRVYMDVWGANGYTIKAAIHATNGRPVIEHNWIFTDDGQAIVAIGTKVLVSNNLIQTSGQDQADGLGGWGDCGIYVSATYYFGSTIENNSVVARGDGIILDGTFGVYNSIKDNLVILNDDWSWNACIRVESSICAVTGNKMDGGKYGIRLDPGAITTMDSEVVGNYIDMNDGGIGVYVMDGDRVTISANVFRGDLTTVGVKIEDSDLVNVTGNVIKTVTGLLLNGTIGDVMYKANLFDGTTEIDDSSTSLGNLYTDLDYTDLDSPLTTKGDLWGFDTDDARLPVGTDDYVLTADAAETLGVRWAAAVTGGLDLTTKGQIHTHGAADAALTVGSDDQVLIADATETTGLKWVDNVLEQAFGRDGAVATSTGTNRWYTKTAKTIISVHASVGVTSSSGVVTVDVHKDNTTIFTTQANRPEIAASGYVSDLETPDVTTFAVDSYLTVDIDAAGTDVEDLVVVVKYKEIL